MGFIGVPSHQINAFPCTHIHGAALDPVHICDFGDATDKVFDNIVWVIQWIKLFLRKTTHEFIKNWIFIRALILQIIAVH